MDSLVLQLQRDALDAEVAVSALLLKAKTVATKLNLLDALEWINAEFSGYTTFESTPEYRHLSAAIEAWNPITAGSRLDLITMKFAKPICIEY